MNRPLVLLAAAAFLAVPWAAAHEPRGTPKNYCEPPSEWSVHEYGPPASGRTLGGWIEGGDVFGDCGALPDTSDGHHEYAFGGAWLLVEGGDGSPDPAGAGSLYCFGEEAHHAAFGPVLVEDASLPDSVSFVVGADTAVGGLGIHGAAPYAPSPECGDWQIDESIACLDACSVPFAPGLDGAYHVFVHGTAGHVVG